MLIVRQEVSAQSQAIPSLYLTAPYAVPVKQVLHLRAASLGWMAADAARAEGGDAAIPLKARWNRASARTGEVAR
jgi:hypothetical protein